MLANPVPAPVRPITLILVLALLSSFSGRAQVIDTILTVGNHELHFRVTPGTGVPIVFESGNGDDGTVWDTILPELHEKTGAPLITYDRAGLGKSVLDTNAVSFRDEGANLKIALHALGYTETYFLVAHSFGGFYASLFADANPGAVKGAVFIDTATPCFMSRQWSANYVAAIPGEAWGMIRQYRLGLYHVLRHLPEITDYMSTRYLSPEIPLTLIVAENLPNENTLRTETDRQNWINCLRAFGDHPNRKYVLAEGADHHVWRKRPELVVEEIVKRYDKSTKR